MQLVVDRELTFHRQANRMDASVGTEFHAFGVHAQQRDIVVVRRRAVSLVLDHSQHFQIDVFGLVAGAAVVFQQSDPDVFPVKPVRKYNVVVRSAIMTSTNSRRNAPPPSPHPRIEGTQ